MKKTLLLLGFVLLSCNTKLENSGDVGHTSDSGETRAELIPHPLIDNKGQIMGQMTLPSNWQLHNEPGKAAFSGPDGILVYNIPIRNFMYSNDAMIQQAYARNGGKLREPISASTIIQQDFVPTAQKEGSKLVDVYDAPEIAKSDASVQDMMYRIGPSYAKYHAVVSEWEDKDGNPYAIILHLNVNEIGNAIMWSYYGQGLDAPKERYESAKKILIDGLASLEYNPRYFDQYNRNEQQRESTSWAAHNQRMAQRQQQFDAQQGAFKQRSDAVNQSIMSGYESRSAASDKNHNRFLNYIKDENTVSNPADGQRYQVQAGANQYYMNQYGQYVGTNDPNYDPNRNQGTNGQTWNEVQVTD